MCHVVKWTLREIWSKYVLENRNIKYGFQGHIQIMFHDLFISHLLCRDSKFASYCDHVTDWVDVPVDHQWCTLESLEFTFDHQSLTFGITSHCATHICIISDAQIRCFNWNLWCAFTINVMKNNGIYYCLFFCVFSAESMWNLFGLWVMIHYPKPKKAYICKSWKGVRFHMLSALNTEEMWKHRLPGERRQTVSRPSTDRGQIVYRPCTEFKKKMCPSHENLGCQVSADKPCPDRGQTVYRTEEKMCPSHENLGFQVSADKPCPDRGQTVYRTEEKNVPEPWKPRLPGERGQTVSKPRTDRVQSQNQCVARQSLFQKRSPFSGDVNRSSRTLNWSSCGKLL